MDITGGGGGGGGGGVGSGCRQMNLLRCLVASSSLWYLFDSIPSFAGDGDPDRLIIPSRYDEGFSLVPYRQ